MVCCVSLLLRASVRLQSGAVILLAIPFSFRLDLFHQIHRSPIRSRSRSEFFPLRLITSFPSILRPPVVDNTYDPLSVALYRFDGSALLRSHFDLYSSFRPIISRFASLPCCYPLVSLPRPFPRGSDDGSCYAMDVQCGSGKSMRDDHRPIQPVFVKLSAACLCSSSTRSLWAWERRNGIGWYRIDD